MLFEGAQGTMLDIDHGTYPFVTSSSASAGGACTGTGVPPTRIDGVIGVSKAYITRVGGGPFPTEALDGAGERIRAARQGIRRRHRPAAPLRLVRRAAAALHGRRSTASTAWWSPSSTCSTSSRRFRSASATGSAAREVLEEMPPTVREIEKIEPVYECVPGWNTSTFGISSYDELPAKAKEYLAFLESRTGVEMGCISTGPERNQTIVRPGSRLEKLIG